jgi:hypothetical protein
MGIYGTSNVVSLNNICWGDSGVSGSPEISINNATPTFGSCDVAGGYSGTGNITTDPLFVVGDTLYHLQSTSPCVARGVLKTQIGGVWYQAPTSDYAGLVRPMPLGTYPDIGAQEEQTVVQFAYPGDANNDGAVDARDVLPIGRFYGQTGVARANISLAWSPQIIPSPWSPPEVAYADCNGDGKVDSSDVLGIIENWGCTVGAPAGKRDPLVACRELLKAIDVMAVPSGAMLQIRNAIMNYMNAKLDLPTSFALEQNYPNPFNPVTGIRYQVSGVSGQSSVVSLKVYDLLGREVAVLVNERKNAGTYEVQFDGSKLASGVYFYRIQAGTFVQTRKLVLMK